MTRIAGLLLLAVAAAWSPATAAPSVSAAPVWSKTVDGLRARLIATPTTDKAGHAQVRLEVELDNTRDSAEPLALRWSDDLGAMLKLTVEDNGKPLPDGAMAGSYASGPPYVLLLPVSSTLRKLVSPGIYEYVPSGRTMVRPLTFQGWDLPAKHGALVIRATLSPAAGDPAHPDAKAWTGSLELPAVALP
jgi:hypothetical protein